MWWHLGTSNEVLVVCFWGWESPKTPHPQSCWHSSGFINKPQLNATRGGQSYLPWWGP